MAAASAAQKFQRVCRLAVARTSVAVSPSVSTMRNGIKPAASGALAGATASGSTQTPINRPRRDKTIQPSKSVMTSCSRSRKNGQHFWWPIAGLVLLQNRRRRASVRYYSSTEQGGGKRRCHLSWSRAYTLRSPRAFRMAPLTGLFPLAI
jgi:hypothetical protein